MIHKAIHARTLSNCLGLASLTSALFLGGCLSGSEPKDDISHAGHDHSAGIVADPGELSGPIQTPDGSLPISELDASRLKEAKSVPIDPTLIEISQQLPKAAAVSCNIDFNQKNSLIIIPDTAKFTFATNPWYIQGCGDGWVHVKENETARYGAAWGSNYAHYHLGYTRGEFCITGAGKAGIKTAGVCNAINPANEARDVGSHTGSQWIRVYTYKSGVPEMTFSLKELTVKGTTGITLWFRKTTGEWRFWSRLAPGTWNLSEAASIKEILIRGGDGDLPYFFDNLKVSVP